MDLRFKQVLLFLLFLVILKGCATAESETESLPRSRAPPLTNTVGSVIDGTGTDDALRFDSTENGLGERKVGSSKVSVTTVALFTLAMAAATGLGAVPFFFVELDPQWAGIHNGMAAGVMLAASFDLIQEGKEHGSGNWVVAGILTGRIFIWVCKKGGSTTYKGQSAVVYESEIREQLEEEGYKIWGNVGDQWSDLQGNCTSNRTFKLPNPLYFVP
ncbi:unnamed protein product [Camellia sinensis]